MIKTEVTKVKRVRADSLTPGDRFIDEVHRHMWVRTAAVDPEGQNRVLSMSLHSYSASYFGQGQMVLKVVA